MDSFSQKKIFQPSVVFFMTGGIFCARGGTGRRTGFKFRFITSVGSSPTGHIKEDFHGYDRYG